MSSLNLISLIITLFSSCCYGLTDFYDVKNNQVLQTCAYVSNSENFLQRFFYTQEPLIKLKLTETQGVDQQCEVYTLIMGGEDMKKVTIGLNPYYKVCDEYALSNGYCEHESDEDHLKKQLLSDLIDSNSFSYPIESFMLKLNGQSPDDENHIYKLDKSSIYCIMFLTTTIPESQESLRIEVDWQQSFGKLLVSDFNRMFSSLYFSIIYFIVGIYLLISIYYKIQKEKTSISIDSIKFKKFTFQYKFIIFHFGTSLTYFFTMLNYLILNKFGYGTDSIIVPISNLFSLISTTFITVWLIYNLMLFSAGAWFGGLKNSSLKLYISRIFSIVLILEMLLFDMETSNIYSLIGDSKRDFLSILIYIEFLIIFIISIFWSIFTSFNIKDRKLKNLFYISIGLLTFSFSIVLFGAHIFSATAQSASIAYSIEFVFALIITLLWNNVIIENNEIVLPK